MKYPEVIVRGHGQARALKGRRLAVAVIWPGR